jgi:hypothetical protein
MFDDLVKKDKTEDTEETITHIPIPCCYCGSDNVEIVNILFDDKSEVKAKLCFSCQRAEVIWVVK